MNLIVAADSKWGIGRDGGLLCHLPSDMKYFREKTKGKVVVMGRRTFESLPGGKGLPDRINYVLTTNLNFEAPGSNVINFEDELWDELERYDADDVYLIGGAALYNAFYKRCDRLYITKIDADLGADTFITDMGSDPDFELESESGTISENGLDFKFCVYRKKK